MHVIISGSHGRPLRIDALGAVQLLYGAELPKMSKVSACGVEWSANEWYRAMHRPPPVVEERVAGVRQNPPDWVAFQRAVGRQLRAEHAGTKAVVSSGQSFSVPETNSEIRPDFTVKYGSDIRYVVDAKHKIKGRHLLRIDVLQVWTYTIVLGGAAVVVVPTDTQDAARVLELRRALGVEKRGVGVSGQ